MGRVNWKELLREHKPLLLPAAHDALTARIIERAGFHAFQVGGFALEASRYGFPDIDLVRMGEKCLDVQEIIRSCDLPILVDADDGYGDPKNVAHVMRLYERMGVSAIFIEDQKSPKRCGHMAGKQVIPRRMMEEKIQAAVAARTKKDSVFLIARTDAIAPNGLRDAIERGEAYLNAGADAVYLEGPTSVKQLEEIAAAFRGSLQVVNILEGGGKTPWLPPQRLAEMGFNMVLYPTSILFQVTKTIQEAVMGLKKGLPMPQDKAVTMEECEDVLGIKFWKHVEEQYQFSQ